MTLQDKIIAIAKEAEQENKHVAIVLYAIAGAMSAGQMPLMHKYVSAFVKASIASIIARSN